METAIKEFGTTEQAILENLCNIKKSKNNIVLLQCLLNKHWSRKVRSNCAELLVDFKFPEIVELIIDVGETKKISQKFAVSLLKKINTPLAIRYLIEVEEKNRWYSYLQPYRYGNLDEFLKKSSHPDAILYIWKKHGSSSDIIEKLENISNARILSFLKNLEFSILFDMINTQKVRNFLINNRGLKKAYFKVDGKQGAVHAIENQFSFSKIKKGRLDSLTDKKIKEIFLSPIEIDYYIKDKKLVSYLKKRGVDLLLENKKKEDTEPTEPTEPTLDYIESLSRILDLDSCLLNQVYGQWGRIDTLYKSFEIKKKSGGIRKIEAPSSFLKMIQRKVKDNILYKQNLNDATHGFVPKRSIFTNAKVHVGANIVINLDLKDFFPTISANRVFGVFKKIGFNDFEASFLTRITTCNNKLPQGAPTSPVIANLVAQNLDKRLKGLCKKYSASYTRYADDLTFSGDYSIKKLLPIIRKIIKEESFEIAKEKTCLFRKGRRQEVTGLTVNDKVSIPRHIRKKLRAAVYRISKGENAFWNGKPFSMKSLQGHLAYIRSIQPEFALKLKELLKNSSS